MNAEIAGRKGKGKGKREGEGVDMDVDVDVEGGKAGLEDKARGKDGMKAVEEEEEEIL